MKTNDDIRARFDAIDWTSIDLVAVHAFYESVARPHEDRALIVAQIMPDKREAWRRQCVADLQAMQGRSCPGCAA